MHAQAPAHPDDASCAARRTPPRACMQRRRWFQAAGLLGLGPALVPALGLALGPVVARAQPAVRLIGGVLPLGMAGASACAHHWGDQALEEARRLGFRGEIEWMPWPRAVQEARRGGPALVFPAVALTRT